MIFDFFFYVERFLFIKGPSVVELVILFYVKTVTVKTGSVVELVIKLII
jgi:hypothetical protein